MLSQAKGISLPTCWDLFRGVTLTTAVVLGGCTSTDEGQQPTETLIVLGAGTGVGFVGNDVIQCYINAGTASSRCTEEFLDRGGTYTLFTIPETVQDLDGDGSVTPSSFTGWSGDCSGTGDCTVTLTGPKTVTATFDLIPPTPPTIANAVFTVLEINNPQCTNNWTLFQVDFDYTDPNGDVIGGTVTVDYAFVGGNSGTFVLSDQDIVIRGDGFSGTMNNLVCFGYGGATSVTVTFTLQDAGGLASNPVQVIIPRPPGANLKFESRGGFPARSSTEDALR